MRAISISFPHLHAARSVQPGSNSRPKPDISTTSLTQIPNAHSRQHSHSLSQPLTKLPVRPSSSYTLIIISFSVRPSASSWPFKRRMTADVKA